MKIKKKKCLKVKIFLFIFKQKRVIPIEKSKLPKASCCPSPQRSRGDVNFSMKVTGSHASRLEWQVTERVNIENFRGPILMNRRNELGAGWHKVRKPTNRVHR